MSSTDQVKWLSVFAFFIATSFHVVFTITDCSTNPCKNYATCSNITGCVCSYGYTGNTCEIAITTTYLSTSLSTSSTSSAPKTISTSTISNKTTINPIATTTTGKLTVPLPLPITVNHGGIDYIIENNILKSFEDAVEKCQKFAARLVSNSSNITVAGFVRSLVLKNAYRITGMYWSPHGDYPKVLPHLNGTLCPVTNWYAVSFRPCSERALYICARPTTGKCYPESQVLCPRGSSCLQRRVTYYCKCLRGYYILNQTQCVDINECNIVGRNSSPVCTFANAFCSNIPGSYRCNCRHNMQGNGINICGYVIAMQQSINVSSSPYTQLVSPAALSANSTIPFTATALKEQLYRIYSNLTYSIVQNGVEVKTMQLGSDPQFVSVLYDVYSNDKTISPTTLTEFFKEGQRRMITQWLIAHPPSAASPLCTPSVIGSGNDRFNFPSIKPGNVAPSVQKCPNGRQSATAKCKVKQQTDGTITAYYDYRTLTVVACNKVLLLPNPVVALRPQLVVREGPITFRNLEFLTTNYSAVSVAQIQRSSATINNFAKAVTQTSAKITTSTMIHIVNVANNINKANKFRKALTQTSALTKQENLKLSKSLKICSINLALPPEKSITINSEFVSVEVTNIITRNGTLQKRDGISFVSVLSLPDGGSNTTCSKPLPNNVQTKIPQQALEFAFSARATKQGTDNDSQLVSFMLFRDGKFFYSANQPFKFDQVLAMQLEYAEIKDLTNPVWYHIPTSVKNDPSKLTLFKCAYMDKTTGDWLPNGCKTITESGKPKCTCNHMTNFALLVQTNNLPKNYALEIVGKVGCSISIVGLALMLIIHFSFSKMLDSLVTRAHNHLGVNLLISYMIFLIAVERPRNRTSCIVVAAFIHFFLLNAWGWMTVECYIMYIKFVKVFGDTGSRFLRKTSLLVYLSSAVIVSITLIITVGHYDKITYNAWKTTGDPDLIPSSYISQRLCWLHSLALICGFLIIIGIELVINFVGFFFIFRKISWGRQKVSSNREDSPAIKAYLLRAFTLSTLLGLSWIFAIPLTLTDDLKTNIAFGWLFSITNSLQGFFIFFLFCVKRKDVRDLWWSALKDWLRCRTQHEPETSRTASVSAGAITTVPIRLTSKENSEPTSDENHDTTTNVVKDQDWEFGRTNKLGQTSSFHPKGMN